MRDVTAQVTSPKKSAEQQLQHMERMPLEPFPCNDATNGSEAPPEGDANVEAKEAEERSTLRWLVLHPVFESVFFVFVALNVLLLVLNSNHLDDDVHQILE